MSPLEALTEALDESDRLAQEAYRGRPTAERVTDGTWVVLVGHVSLASTVIREQEARFIAAHGPDATLARNCAVRDVARRLDDLADRCLLAGDGETAEALRLEVRLLAEAYAPGWRDRQEARAAVIQAFLPDAPDYVLDVVRAGWADAPGCRRTNPHGPHPMPDGPECPGVVLRDTGPVRDDR